MGLRYESKWRKGFYLPLLSSDNLGELLKMHYNFQVKVDGNWNWITTECLKDLVKQEIIKLDL